ncbi:MAG: hypothetical protein ACLP0B_13975 [Steroidobacteraceae bacterium]
MAPHPTADKQHRQLRDLADFSAPDRTVVAERELPDVEVEAAQWTAILSIETFEWASKQTVCASTMCRCITTPIALFRYFSDHVSKENTPA